MFPFRPSHSYNYALESAYKAVRTGVDGTCTHLTHHWLWQWGAGMILSRHAYLSAPLVGFITWGFLISRSRSASQDASNVGGAMDAHPTFIPRSDVINALTKLRQEFEEAADDESLVDVEANVGLLLADLAVAIGLTPAEQAQALGAELVNELQGELIIVPGNNGHY